MPPKKPKRTREDKNKKWRELAAKRIDKAVDRIKRLKPLATGNAYAYSQEEAQAVVNALVEAVEEVRDAFFPIVDAEYEPRGFAFPIEAGPLPPAV